MYKQNKNRQCDAAICRCRYVFKSIHTNIRTGKETTTPGDTLEEMEWHELEAVRYRHIAIELSK
jgi:hypothetical protein